MIKSAIRVFFWTLRKPGFRIKRAADYCLLTHPDARLNVVNVRGQVTFDSDGLATMHNCDFLNDPRFKNAYTAGVNTGSWGNSNPAWRAYIGCWAAEQVKNLPGDFVECGVNRGGLSRTVADYISFATLGKTFYLLDTFNGLDERYMTDLERQAKNPTLGGRYQHCYEAVCQTFADISARVIKGSVPDTLTQVDTQQVCYLSIDMNCVEPEIAAIEFFWDKLVPGAIVILDDYGWADCLAQKKAFDRFAQQNQIAILSLPTGQGLIFKPRPVVAAAFV
jgi:O-methyltransferase